MATLSKEQSRWLWGFATGIAATVIVREFMPHFKDVGKPLAKATVRSAIATFEKTRERLARFGESVEDLVAEVQYDMTEERKQKHRTGVESQK
jgi:hypothetical protein